MAAINVAGQKKDDKFFKAMQPSFVDVIRMSTNPSREPPESIAVSTDHILYK